MQHKMRECIIVSLEFAVFPSLIFLSAIATAQGL